MGLLEQHLPELLIGTGYTLVTAILGIALSLVFGVLIGVIQSFRIPGLSVLITGYVEIIRNTPEIVQLFWIYLVLPNIGLNLTVNQAVMAYLTINGTAYIIEIIKGGVISIPRGQVEASKALGIRGVHLYRRIVLPQVFTKVFPSLINQMTMIIKNTTLVSLIAAQDVVYYANHLSSITMSAVPFQVYVGLMFFVVITLLSFAADRFRKRGFLA